MSDLVAARLLAWCTGWDGKIVPDKAPMYGITCAVLMEAANLLKQQAAKIAELERQLAVMTSSRDGYAKQDAARTQAARDSALEEAAKLADELDPNATNVATAIRALKSDAGRSIKGYCTDCENEVTIHNGRCSCGSGRVITAGRSVLDEEERKP